MINYEEFLEQILGGYTNNFDIERVSDVENNLVAKAHMHVTESQCMIFKEMEMWQASADEYVYIFRIPHLTEELCEKAIQYAHSSGMPLIDLDHVSFKNQHMCTHLVALFICDTADEAAIKKVKKCRIYKSFHFSLKGWMEMHTDLITLEDSKVYNNRYGTETAKFLKMHVEYYKKQHV